MDIQGPKLRFAPESIDLVNDSVVSYKLSDLGIETSDATDSRGLEVGHRILMDDGRIETVVENVEGERFSVRVRRGGFLQHGKGVNLPDTEVRGSLLSDKDLADVAVARDLGVEIVAVSFVQTPSDILSIRELIGDDILLFAKIERPQALERIDEICAVSDGAAAVVLGSEAQARQRGGRLIQVAGCAIATGQFGDPALRIPNVASPAHTATPHTSEVVGAVQRALAMAGVGPQDIDLLEMADNTAWHLLAWPELFGFYEAGQGDWMLAQGELDIDGRCPVNPSGGFLSSGEATTAQGVLQVCELVWQLRGQAQGRQVQGARLGMSAVLGLGANGASVILKT